MAAKRPEAPREGESLGGTTAYSGPNRSTTGCTSGAITRTVPIGAYSLGLLRAPLAIGFRRSMHSTVVATATTTARCENSAGLREQALDLADELAIGRGDEAGIARHDVAIAVNEVLEEIPPWLLARRRG
jgi:hypothetical protein